MKRLTITDGLWQLSDIESRWVLATRTFNPEHISWVEISVSEILDQNERTTRASNVVSLRHTATTETKKFANTTTPLWRLDDFEARLITASRTFTPEQQRWIDVIISSILAKNETASPADTSSNFQNVIPFKQAI